MGLYPINLQLTGKRCLVIGGGQVAERKVKRLLQAEAQVVVLSPSLTAGLLELAAAGRINHRCVGYEPGCVSGYFLVICATDNQSVNSQAAQEAADNGALVNVIDDESASSFTVPASVERGEILFTVSTGGKSPALARELRADLAKMYGVEFADYLQLVEAVRNELKEKVADSRSRARFWRQAVNERTIELLKDGNIDKAEAELKDAIACFRVKS